MRPWKNECVVGVFVFASGFPLAHPDAPGGAIDADDLGFDAHIQIEASLEATGVCTSRLSCSAISPPTKYGSPQLAKDTCGPRSNTMISHSSHSRRARAAALAPPATPPTMIRRLLFRLFICKRNAETKHPRNHGQPEQPGDDDYGDVHKFSSRLSQHSFRDETDPWFPSRRR